MLKQMRKILMGFFCAGLMLSTISVYAETNVNRIAGNSRYETAIEISKNGWTTSDNVVIATGEDFPDALCAAPLAKKLDAPILLTDKEGLGEKLRSEITRLKVKNAYIVGGQGVVSINVENELKNMGIVCKRLAGDSRYATSIEVAKELGNTSEIVIATGSNFPDALSIAPISAKKGTPIILTLQNSLPDVVESYLLNKSIDKSYVIGGTGVISEAVASKLPNSERLFGSNRFLTNIAILNRFSSELSLSSAYLATGDDFPDALAGAALAPKTSSPLILVSEELDEGTKNYLSEKSLDVTKLNLIGGKGAISLVTLSIIQSNMNYVSVKSEMEVKEAVAKALTHGKSLSFRTLKSLNVDIYNITYDFILNSYKDNLSNMPIIQSTTMEDNIYLYTIIELTSKEQMEEEEKFMANGSIKINLYANDVIVGYNTKVNVDIINKPINSTATVKYSVSDTDLAVIDGNGNLTVLKEGYFYVEVEYLSKSDHKYLNAKPQGTIIINNEEDFYNAIKNAVINGDDSIDIISNDANLYDKYLDLVDKVINDYADYADYISSWVVSTNYVKFNYSISKELVDQRRIESDQKSRQIIETIIKPGMTDLQKERAIHDYIINNSKYDYQNYLNGTILEDSYNSYGVLVKGVGVCASYAKAMMKLLNLAGLECYYVTGYGNGEPHAWNIVKIDGRYYHVDATFDDPIVNGGSSQILSHEYFNISDSVMQRDHYWDRSKYPACVN